MAALTTLAYCLVLSATALSAPLSPVVDLGDYCGKTLLADKEHSGGVLQLSSNIPSSTCRVDIVAKGGLVLGIALKEIYTSCTDSRVQVLGYDEEVQSEETIFDSYPHFCGMELSLDDVIQINTGFDNTRLSVVITPGLAGDLKAARFFYDTYKKDGEPVWPGMSTVSVEAVPTADPATSPPSTEEPSTSPTSRPTSRPTSPPTSSPTSRPTSPPTSPPTSSPTSRPTSELSSKEASPSKSQTSEPASSTPQTSEPASSTPQTSEPASSTPQTSEPASSTPQTAEPASSTPQTAEPASSTPQTAEPASSTPQTSEPASSTLQTSATPVSSTKVSSPAKPSVTPMKTTKVTVNKSSPTKSATSTKMPSKQPLKSTALPSTSVRTRRQPSTPTPTPDPAMITKTRSCKCEVRYSKYGETEYHYVDVRNVMYHSVRESIKGDCKSIYPCVKTCRAYLDKYMPDKLDTLRSEYGSEKAGDYICTKINEPVTRGIRVYLMASASSCPDSYQSHVRTLDYSLCCAGRRHSYKKAYCSDVIG